MADVKSPEFQLGELREHAAKLYNTTPEGVEELMAEEKARCHASGIRRLVALKNEWESLSWWRQVWRGREFQIRAGVVIRWLELTAPKLAPRTRK